MGVIDAGECRQSLPGFDRDRAVGFGSKRQNHLGRIDCRKNLWTSVRHAFVSDGIIQCAKLFDLFAGLPCDPLATVAE